MKVLNEDMPWSLKGRLIHFKGKVENEGEGQYQYPDPSGTTVYIQTIPTSLGTEVWVGDGGDPQLVGWVKAFLRWRNSFT